MIYQKNLTLLKKVYGSWIEYFNRLVGVILGISMLFTFYKSFSVYKSDKLLFYGSFTSLLLIIIAGWIGGQIATNIDGENIIFSAYCKCSFIHCNINYNITGFYNK